MRKGAHSVNKGLKSNFKDFSLQNITNAILTDIDYTGENK